MRSAAIAAAATERPVEGTRYWISPNGTVPPDMRAFSNSVLSLCFNLFGLGLGPWFTGLCSDLFARDPAMGGDALRYALALSLVPSALGAVMFVYAARYFKAGGRS